ncbi:HAMP domain-containing histidine kinase [Paenibacillus donghaensis]|uniref:HAMP domain-containing sensor histidine kinase n=1 Tax=Paenibacillus donghaensis TaxID=414771 RepID=UPI0018833631|nr:HAMP domain-containing sensor histidine kinase [Paenibacillus donghaensis]MBE9918313.1 HAMP domain-containing histidine kinase [Paenibacillus donghaensis]
MEVHLNASHYTESVPHPETVAALAKYDGWLEYLDRDRRIVRTVNTKRDTVTEYSETDLIQLLANNKDKPYYYSAAVMPGDGVETFVLLKLPRQIVTTSAELSPEPSLDFVPSFGKRIKWYLYGLISMIIVFIILYSYWIARRIRKPLKQLTDGMSRMIEGDYNTRIELNAEKEFMQIRNTFNYMADVIERTTEDKRRVEQSKQRLMMDLSHDLITPITSIMGYAQAIRDGKGFDAEQRDRYLRYIFSKAQSMTQLIRSMVEAMKMESPDYKLSCSILDASEFVREIVAGIYGDVESQQFQLNVVIPDQPLYARFDPEAFQRVLLNLLSNALRYNPPGTVLRVELAEEPQTIRVEVADTGVGIPAELRETIFDSFVRGDQARSGSGGFGLGLSIARNLILKMGGGIRLTDTEEEPTFFVIRLPKA